MAKLTGAKKKAFLERMAKGRRKAERKRSPAKKKKAAARKKKAVKKNGARKPAAKKNAKRKPVAKKQNRSGLTKHLKRSGKSGKPHHTAQAAHKHASSVKRQSAKRNGKSRRNSDGLDRAERMFETFHGKPPGRVIEYDSLYRYPENYAELGKLIELRVWLDSANPDFPLTRFGACQAVSTPDGSNIYFIGGDQSIDFESLDIASDKDFVELGPCTYICYFTVKGFHDFEPTKYWHRFGEEDKILPTLVYDRLNKSLFLTSGNYRVQAAGIVN